MQNKTQLQVPPQLCGPSPEKASSSPGRPRQLSVCRARGGRPDALETVLLGRRKPMVDRGGDGAHPSPRGRQSWAPGDRREQRDQRCQV